MAADVSSADMAEDVEDVYTVIPTAPEDMLFDSSLDTSLQTPPSRKKVQHPPSMAFPVHHSNGSLHHNALPSRHGQQKTSNSREGGKRKDGETPKKIIRYLAQRALEWFFYSHGLIVHVGHHSNFRLKFEKI